MSFVDIGGGATKLSQITIDADKDWQAKGISNVKEAAAGMAVGDIVFRNSSVIAASTPGVIGSELITMGPNHDPRWGWVA